jgi:enamine deaminase RidA (YjgF/YER057c/UK114 family)
MAAAPGPEARLAELGITLPDVAAPVASYVPAVRSGRYVYTSGQLPFVDGALPEVGKVGAGDGLVAPDRAAEHARTCALNALAAVRSVVGSLDAVARIVKVVGFVASDASFTGQPAVVNGASNVLGEIFGDAGVHARSAVGVAVLPLDAPVEVELIVEIADSPAARFA